MVPFGIEKPYVTIDGIPVDLSAIPPKSITMEQYDKVQANSAGFERLYPLLDDECLIQVVQYIVKNCQPRYPGTYDWALVHSVVPELLKRIQESMVDNENDDFEGHVCLPKNIGPGQYRLQVNSDGSWELYTN